MAPHDTPRASATERVDRQRLARSERDALEIETSTGASRQRPILSQEPAFEFRPSLMRVLEGRAWDSRLQPRLPTEEEDAIRQLRNLGLVRHDGLYLFAPTRSAFVEPTAAGRLLIALYEDVARADRQEIAALPLTLGRSAAATTGTRPTALLR